MRVLHILGKSKSGQINPSVLAQINSLSDEVDCHTYFYEGSTYWSYIKSILRLSRYLKEVNPDLVHAHFSRSAAMVILSGWRGKLLCSFMGTDVFGSSKVNYLLRKYIPRVADFIILKSRNMIDFFPSSINVKLKVVPNGVDKSIFYPADKKKARLKLGLPLTDKIIVFPSSKKRLEKDFSLAKESVKKSKNLLGSKVLLLTLENVSYDKVPDYFNAADVVLLTSKYEGSPNSIKEALCCGTPVVSVDVGDVREWVIDGAGLVASERNPSLIADCIMRVFSGLGENSFHGEWIPSLKDVKAEIISCYEKVLRDNFPQCTS